MIARANDLGLEQEIQEDVSCCFAVQDKTWVKGPENDWEFYFVKGDAPAMSLRCRCNVVRARVLRAGDGSGGEVHLLLNGDERSEKGLDAAVDLVADRADGSMPLPGGVVELPVQVALAGIERAGVAAAHGDDDVGGLDGGVVELLGMGAVGVRSMPSSAIASTTAGLISSAGAVPAERTTTRSPAWWASRAAAICERPALWTQTNSTSGRSAVGCQSSVVSEAVWG